MINVQYIAYYNLPELPIAELQLVPILIAAITEFGAIVAIEPLIAALKSASCSSASQTARLLDMAR